MHVTGNAILGSLSTITWVDLAPSLLSLDLSGNALTGPLPNNLGDLKSLKFLNLSGNLFTGELWGPYIGCCMLQCRCIAVSALLYAMMCMHAVPGCLE